MANYKFIVPLDNYIQNGDTTLAELVTATAAVNGGIHPGVAAQVRDPATGKLIRVELTLPDTASSAAADAINANPGVSGTVGALPPALAFTDLATADGMAWSGAALAAQPLGQKIACRLAEGFQNGASLTVAGQLTSTGYSDLGSLLNSVAMQVLFECNSLSAADLTINSGELVLKNTGDTEVPIVLTAPLVVPYNASFQNFVGAWIGLDGKIYLWRSTINGVSTPAYSYEDAVALGAL